MKIKKDGEAVDTATGKQEVEIRKTGKANASHKQIIFRFQRPQTWLIKSETELKLSQCRIQ